MVQCWDADPLKRPDTITLEEQIRKIHLSYRNMPNELFQSKTINNFEIKTSTNYTSRTLFTSKIYQFDNLPEQKIATKDIQNDHEKETIQQMKEPVNDDDEIYNNSNLHSKD
ncbi:kinase-like domain-containing protein [Rhizophagus irregularis DAOM 181602=DAOM 197198]|nr:kinase-like domain-containing protein [Rhizophagus irregularis DAOM 181602=DAOM 197198]